MKAAFVKNNEFIIKETLRPALSGRKGAIVKVSGCGLCGSDIVKLKSPVSPDGCVLGHEIIGEITEINTNTSFTAGSRITAGHHIPCFACRYCLGRSYSMCRHFKQTNFVPGGFAEYIYLSEEHLNNTAFQVNMNLSSIEASFTEPLGCCIRAVKRADIADNSKNLIMGLGSIGILMGQAVKASGNEAYGCDILEERVKLSEKYGFDKSFRYTNEEDALKQAGKIISDGFDTVFLTAGSASALDFAVKAVRDGGKIIVFSSIRNNGAFKNNEIYYRGLTVISSYSSSPADLEDAYLLLETGKVRVLGLSSVYKLEDINDAVNDTLSNKIMKAYIEI